jgi:hypothetical protein
MLKTVLILLLSFQAHAMIAPPNDMKIYPHNLTDDRISHANFNKAINLVYNHYAPLLARQGWTLQFNRLWADPTVNSDTHQSGRTIIINSYGGLARHPLMRTVAEYALVACHELGHSLGGFPYYQGERLSVEGQADRYGAGRCMTAIGYDIKSTQDASLGLARLLASLSGEPLPSIPGPALQPYPWGIMETHPPAQCRLDEYLAAGLNRARRRCWYNP